MGLYHQFSVLSCATSHSNFTAIPLSARRRDFLAKSADGAPIFLLQDASSAQYSPGVQFRHLTAQFHATCHVSTDGAELQDQFALVACDSSVPELHEIFIRCFGAAIEELPTTCGTAELNSCIQKLINLFKELSQPNGRQVSGLWAELYVIASCSDVSQALSVWHTDPFDRFDFSEGPGCIEVKASTQPIRVHEFALEQLMTPVNGVGYVVSLLLQPLSGGMGVMDLANAIDAKVLHSAALRQKLWSNVAKALGRDFSDKLDKRFDMSYAERHLAAYAMNDIPRPEHPTDPRVTSVRFLADLTTVASSLKKTPSVSLCDFIFEPL